MLRPGGSRHDKLKFLNDKMHGILDYGVVIIFALAPSLLASSAPRPGSAMRWPPFIWR